MLSLHEAIQQAEASPQAHEGQDRVDAAQGLVTQAGLRPNPRLYLSADDLRPWADNFDFANQTEDYGYFGQLFELGGKRGRRIDLARAHVQQVEAARMLLRQQIAARVASAYWNAVTSAGIVKLLESDREAVEEIVAYNQKRMEAGATAGVDVLRLQIEDDRLRLSLEAARREVVLTRIELLKQIGRSPDEPLQLTESIDSAAPIRFETLTVVLATRADVAEARGAVKAADADVRLQHALRVPDPDLLAGYKRNSGNNTIYTSLQIPLPLLNRNQGEVQRAQADVALAQDRLQQLELSVRADVAAAEEDYRQQQAVVRDILPDMRVRAKQNLTIMDDAYRSGGMDLLRYLDAERTAFDVEASALRTLANFQQARLRLQLAYGVTP